MTSKLNTEIHEFHENKLYDEKLNKLNNVLLKASYKDPGITDNEFHIIYELILQFLNLVRFKYKKTSTANSSNAVIYLFMLKTNNREFIVSETDISKNILTQEAKNTICNYILQIFIGFRKKNKSALTAQIIVTKKKKTEPLSPTNSRVLIDNNDIMKVIFKIINIVFIEPIFNAGLVNTDIQIAKKVILKKTKKTDIYCYVRKGYISNPRYELSFKSVGTTATELLKCDSFMLLDLSNAYNNLSFHTLFKLLYQKIRKLNIFNNAENFINHMETILEKNRLNFVELEDQETDIKDDSIFDKYNDFDNEDTILPNDEINRDILNLDILDEPEFDIYQKEHISTGTLLKKLTQYRRENLLGCNIVLSIVKMMTLLKYTNPNLNYKDLMRNKGVPQGSSVSKNLFIIAMDIIINHIIHVIENNLKLKHNIDYQLLVYVDDIAIKFLNFNAKVKSKDMFNIFSDIMSKYGFKINSSKTLCSKDIAEITNFQEIAGDDKYLGIYYEEDKAEYLKLIESELKSKYTDYITSPKNIKKYTINDIDYMFSFSSIENNIEKFKKFEYGMISLRGKIQFRVVPFCKDKNDRYELFKDAGYPKIAALLFT